MTDSIVSVGIDIGTATTHLSISRLRLQNIATINQVPRIAVLDRDLIYKSQVYDTPLNADGSINATAVALLIKNEYGAASFAACQIHTGAVIITGETARLRNAKEVSLAISEMAGDFVVASAGALLECLLAGRGSGAEQASKKFAKTICNIDIGGGTTNLAVFKNGELLDAACLGIGARFLQFDETGMVVGYTDSGETFLDGVAKLHLLPVESNPDIDLLELIAALLSEVILHSVSRKVAPQIVQRLMITDPLRMDYHIDEYWISGGVGECMRSDNNAGTQSENNELTRSDNIHLRQRSSDDPFLYKDMGILLSQALGPAFNDRSLPYKIAESGIRSTVIGAGMHSLQLSGCTVMVSENCLPLRNVPIISPFASHDAQLSEAEILARLNFALKNHECYAENMPVAISICDISKLTYDEIQAWAKALVNAHQKHLSKQPLIILSKADIGLALGQTIKKYAPEIEQVILDNIDTSMGDLIDIGKQMPNRESVPLTVKTLIFGE